jgi:hypothetical protein
MTSVFWDVVLCSLTEIGWHFRGAYCTLVMMEAVSTSELSLNFHETAWHNISEDSHCQSESAFFICFNSPRSINEIQMVPEV